MGKFIPTGSLRKRKQLIRRIKALKQQYFYHMAILHDLLREMTDF